MSEPSRPFGQTFNRILRILAAGTLVGIGALITGQALNDELLLLGLLLAFICGALIFVAPAITLALPAFRSRPAPLREVMRVPAALSGVGIAALGALCVIVATDSAWRAAGLLLAAPGAWAAAQAVALPRTGSPAATRPALVHSAFVIAGGVVALSVAAAVPRFGGTKAGTYVALMKADLRSLAVAEETYYADSLKYTADPGALGLSFHASTGVVGPTIMLTPDGWTAAVTHQSTTANCAIFVGSTPLPPATTEGEARCDDKPPPFAPPAALVVALVLAAGAGVGVSLRWPPAPS